MGRIIIDFDESTTPDRVLDRVRLVVLQGKISKTTKGIKHYCWHTSFRGGFEVSVRVKKKGQTSDSFIVWKKSKEGV